jgi:hypothetical protein
MSYLSLGYPPILRYESCPKFPKNDGKQTPMSGHSAFIAQHATTTCCRKYVQKWHGIEKGRALNEKEVDFIVVLIVGGLRGSQMIKRTLYMRIWVRKLFQNLQGYRKSEKT